MSEDLELLRRWDDGDQRAARKLFDRHFESLWRFFATKVDDSVGDLVQQTLLACVEARGRIRDPSRFRSFLFGLARIELLRFLRSRAREREAMEVEERSVVDLGTSPSSVIARDDRQQALLTALRQLPVGQQMAVELFYWERLPAPEIADALDISLGTVHSRLARGRERLRDLLGAFEAEPPRS